MRDLRGGGEKTYLRLDRNIPRSITEFLPGGSNCSIVPIRHFSEVCQHVNDFFYRSLTLKLRDCIGSDFHFSRVPLNLAGYAVGSDIMKPLPRFLSVNAHFLKGL